MTEAQWMNCIDLELMQEVLSDLGRISPRKLRLFGCACCRSIWHLLTDDTCRRAVEMAEQFADGRVDLGTLRTAHYTAEEVFQAAWNHARTFQSGGETHISERGHALAYALPGLARSVTLGELNEKYARDVSDTAITLVMYSAIPPHLWGTGAGDAAAEQAIDSQIPRHPHIFRCIFGNPFRSVALTLSWLHWNDATVPRIAQSIYDSRDFSLMPILADALEDAGCDNADILNHCRQPGEHVRGCWVVDLLLGKSCARGAMLPLPKGRASW